MKRKVLLLLGIVLFSTGIFGQTDTTKIQLEALKFDSDSLRFELKEFRAKNDSLRLLLQKNQPVIDSLKRTLRQYQHLSDTTTIEEDKRKRNLKKESSHSNSTKTRSNAQMAFFRTRLLLDIEQEVLEG